MIRSSLSLQIVLAGLSVLPLTAEEGEFRKQIVVYLDSSGSMLPGSSNPGDPFQKTLEALQLFLGEPGFVTAADSITVATFGGQVDSRTCWTGASNPSLELAAVPRDAKAETDFAAVFDQLAKELDPNADRRLVIIASDFIQEPRARGASPAASLTSWNDLTRARLPRLQQLFGKDPKQRLLLLRAPVREDRKEFLSLRERIVEDLVKATGADDFDIGAGGLGADELARLIRKKLLHDLEVEARYDANGQQIQVTVTNPNGQGLELRNLRITCLDEQEKDIGDTVHLAVPSGESRLGASGGEGSTRVLSPLPLALACLEKAPKYRAGVVTEEGAEGAVVVSNTSWIIHRVDDAKVESRLFRGDLLRLYLTMRGYGEPGRKFHLTVHPNGSAKATSDLGEWTFVAPSELEPFEDKRFLFALSVPKGTSHRFDGERAIRVEINAAPAEGAGSRDDGASAANWMLGLLCLLLIVAQLLLALLQRENLNTVLGICLTAVSTISSNPAAFLAALASPRLALLELFPNGADWVRLLALVLVVPLATFVTIRQYLGYRLARELRDPHPELTAAELLRKLQGTRPAVFGALIVLGLVVTKLALTSSWSIEPTTAISVAVTPN